MPTPRSVISSGFKLPGIALLSAGGLVLELTLTRVFSVLYAHAFVYVLLAVAVLGIGLGATLATWHPALRAEQRLPLWASLAGSAALLITLLTVLLSSFGAQLVILTLITLPYLFIGLALATLFSQHSEISSKLYWADLAGAGLGAVLAVPLLNFVGGLNGALAASLLPALAGILFAVAGNVSLSKQSPPAQGSSSMSPDSVNLTKGGTVKSPPAPLIKGGVERSDDGGINGGGANTTQANLSTNVTVPTSFSLIIGLILISNIAWPWLQIDMGNLATPKPIQEQLEAGGKIVATRWNAFARTDLVYRPDQNAYYLYVGGAAGSLVPDTSNPAGWQSDIGIFPFATSDPESVFIIGPGGGLDVALAKATETEELVAAELNRASIELVRGLRDYAGDLYGDEVTVLFGEGRSALRRLEQDFDLIFLSQVVTQAAELRGYALTQNSVYTVEAFHDYLEHLTSDGVIALKLYDELTLTRALTTAIKTFKERGLSDAEATRHLLAILDTSVQPAIPLLLIYKDAIGRSEAIGLARAAERHGFALLLVPGLLANPALEAVLNGESSLADLIASAEQVNISPTTDDQPFFYQFERGLPELLEPLIYGIGGLLVLALLALLWKQRGETQRVLRLAPWLFAALGFGFMSVEIAVLQQVQLFLGHPTLGLSTVLGTLLIGGGIGSALGGKLGRGQPILTIAGSGLFILLTLLLWTAGWPSISNALRGGTLPLRVSVTALSLMPLALLMGMPFPLALRFVGRYGKAPVALAWSVNGLTSVGGSVGATVLALNFGFSSVMLAGGLCYLLVAVTTLIIWRWNRRQIRAPIQKVARAEQ